MNSRTAIAILLCTIAAYIAACTGNETSGFTNIAPDGWAYGDTVRFCPSDSDSTYIATGDIAVVIRHSNRYEYSNIWLRMDYQGADAPHTDTLNIQLADVYGNWLGKGLGVSFQRSDTVARDVRIDVSKPIKISHIMRNDTLADIEQVGILFLPHAKLTK